MTRFGGKRRRVLLICPHYEPEFIAGANYMRTLVSALRKGGWDIIVVATQPCFPFGTAYPKAPWRERRPGIEVVRVPSAIPTGANPSPNRRIAHFIAYAVMSFLVGLYLVPVRRVDRIVVSGPPEIPFASAAALAALYRRPLIVSMRDTWFENAIALGFISENSMGARIMRAVRRRAFRRASAIIATSRYILRKTGESFHLPTKRLVVTNTFDASLVQPRAPIPHQILYLGNLGHAYDFGPLLEAMRILPNHYRLVLVGEGDQRAAIEKAVAAQGLSERVVIRVCKDKPAVYDWLAHAHIGLSPLKEDPALMSVLPIKLIEYMAAGLPFVATGLGETETLCQDSRSGIHARLDGKALASAILTLASDPERLAEMSLAGQAYVARFSLQNVAHELECAVSE